MSEISHIRGWPKEPFIRRPTWPGWPWNPQYHWPWQCSLCQQGVGREHHGGPKAGLFPGCQQSDAGFGFCNCLISGQHFKTLISDLTLSQKTTSSDPCYHSIWVRKLVLGLTALIGIQRRPTLNFCREGQPNPNWPQAGETSTCAVANMPESLLLHGGGLRHRQKSLHQPASASRRSGHTGAGKLCAGWQRVGESAEQGWGGDIMGQGVGRGQISPRRGWEWWQRPPPYPLSPSWAQTRLLKLMPLILLVQAWVAPLGFLRLTLGQGDKVPLTPGTQQSFSLG